MIEELKDFSSLALDELIENLKVHEVVMDKDSEIYRGKNERVKSIPLKAKDESSDDETLTSRSDDKEYAMAVRNFKKLFRRKAPPTDPPDTKDGSSNGGSVKMDDPNITMKEYIRLKEEKAQRHGRTFNWQTSTFGKIKYYEDDDDCFTDLKIEFPAIAFDNT
nr:alpha/beta hydrolases superfamily protein [Tanacetum cinerariifolium]